MNINDIKNVALSLNALNEGKNEIKLWQTKDYSRLWHSKIEYEFSPHSGQDIDEVARQLLTDISHLEYVVKKALREFLGDKDYLK